MTQAPTPTRNRSDGSRRIPVSAFVRGFLRLVRVRNLLIVVATQYLARYFLVGWGGPPSRSAGLALLADRNLFLLAFSTGCIAAAGYIINDYFDVKIDLVNKPRRVVIGRYLKRRWALVAHQVLNVLGCAIGLYLSRWVFLADVVSVSLLWFYSANLKRQPLIGNVVISLLTALTFLVLALYYRQNVPMLLVYAAFSFGISLVREIIKDMEDIRGDARFGCRTLPIVWGIRRTKNLLYGLIATFIALLFLTADALHNPRLGQLFLGLLLPISYLVWRLVQADTRQAFGQLSQLCKLIMLLGVLSMIWA
jgi:4-hydroxybenzoate polyprenyltransferase